MHCRRTWIKSKRSVNCHHDGLFLATQWIHVDSSSQRFTLSCFDCLLSVLYSVFDTNLKTTLLYKKNSHNYYPKTLHSSPNSLTQFHREDHRIGTQSFVKRERIKWFNPRFTRVPLTMVTSHCPVVKTKRIFFFRLKKAA